MFGFIVCYLCYWSVNLFLKQHIIWTEPVFLLIHVSYFFTKPLFVSQRIAMLCQLFDPLHIKRMSNQDIDKMMTMKMIRLLRHCFVYFAFRMHYMVPDMFQKTISMKNISVFCFINVWFCSWLIFFSTRKAQSSFLVLYFDFYQKWNG